MEGRRSVWKYRRLGGWWGGQTNADSVPSSVEWAHWAPSLFTGVLGTVPSAVYALDKTNVRHPHPHADGLSLAWAAPLTWSNHPPGPAPSLCPPLGTTVHMSSGGVPRTWAEKSFLPPPPKHLQDRPLPHPSQESMVVKITGPGVRLPGFKTCLCHLLAGRWRMMAPVPPFSHLQSGGGRTHLLVGYHEDQVS